MKNVRPIIALLVVLFAACSAPDVAEVVPGELLGTELPTAQPTATDEPTPTVLLPTAIIEPTEVPVSASNCLGCHTDQATLELLAVEEEHTGEALSTGEG